MWEINTIWFDVAVVMSIFAVGSILFGHFEEHKPKWRRLLKIAIVLSIFLGLVINAGRVWGYLMLAIPLLGASVIHLWWLPKHGINGWTGSNSQFEPNWLLAKQRLAERWGAEKEKRQSVLFFCPHLSARRRDRRS